MLTPDKERVKELLCETITLLCKNGLHFQDEFCIDGLIGITLDQSDVFLVTIKETVKHGEVFVRDRQHSTRSHTVEEPSHGASDNQIAVISEGDSHPEGRSDLDSVTRLQDTNSEEPDKEVAAVADSVAAKDPGVCQMETDEQVVVKAEEGAGSKETDTDSRMAANDKRHKSSRASENSSCRRQSSHNVQSQTSPAAHVEKDQNSSVDRIQEEYLPTVPYNEMNSTVAYRDESKESPDINSQLSIESSVQSMFSSADHYYRAGPAGHNEKKIASEGSDSGQNSNQKPDTGESDGDELVVVKVEPPSSDYPDDQFSSLSSYRQTQANDAHNFVSDSNYMYNRIKNMAGYSVKHSHGVPSFDYGSQMVETSVHGSGYSQQFSPSFQMNRYQMKLGMNQGALQNDSSQSPHQSGLDKKQPNSLLPALSKPYRRIDYSKGTPEHDLHQMPFPMPPMPDLNNSLPENESTMMQTDLEKYAEMQSFCMNRRARSTFTAYQLQRLESAFKCAHYVDAATRSKLAEELNLSDSIILVWFQNRRQKFKKQMKMNFS